MNVNNIINLQSFLNFLDTLVVNNNLSYNLNNEEKIKREELIEELKEKIIESENDVDFDMMERINLKIQEIKLNTELEYYKNRLIEINQKKEKIEQYKILTLNEINKNI